MVLRQIAKAALAMVLVFGLFIVAFAITDHIKSSKLREFCSSIQDQQLAEEVIAKAREQGFPVFPPTEKRPGIAILNHKQPFFRYVCDVTIRDGRVVRTQILGAD